MSSSTTVHTSSVLFETAIIMGHRYSLERQVLITIDNVQRCNGNVTSRETSQN